MASEIKLRVLVPVRSDEADVRAYCDQFGLTLVSFLREPHRLCVVVEEDVSDAQKQQIASSLSSHLASTLVTVEK